MFYDFNDSIQEGPYSSFLPLPPMVKAGLVANPLLLVLMGIYFGFKLPFENKKKKKKAFGRNFFPLKN